MISQPALTIPTYVTEMHNENFRYWMQLKDSLLLHIDAHSDMGSPFVNGIETTEIDFYKNLSIADFICPARRTFFYNFILFDENRVKHYGDRHAFFA